MLIQNLRDKNNYLQLIELDRDAKINKFWTCLPNPGLFFFYFRPFLIPIAITASVSTIQIVCLGLKPGAAELYAQTKPRSFGCRPRLPTPYLLGIILFGIVFSCNHHHVGTIKTPPGIRFGVQQTISNGYISIIEKA